MPAIAIPQHEIDRLATEGAAELRRQRLAAIPPLVNARFARTLEEDDVLIWRGREYKVPAIPYELGAELYEISHEMQMMAKGEGDMRAYRILMRRAVGLFPRLIHRRLGWLRPNPFRRISAPEVGALMGFFFACQRRQPAGGSAPPVASSQPRT